MVCGKYNIGDGVTFVLRGKGEYETVLRNGIITSCCGDGERRRYIVKTPTGDEYSVSEQLITGYHFRTIADIVNHPPHYTQGGIECIDAIAAATSGLNGIEAVCTANAIKYLWRWKHKNGVEDLKKAAWYIQRLIEEQGGE